VGRCFESFTEEQREDGYRKLEYVKLSELLFQRFSHLQPSRPDLLPRYTRRPETGYQNAVDCIARFRRIRAAHELNKRPSELPLEKYSGSTNRNWRNKYLESGANIVALVHRDDKKGNRKERLANEVVKVLEKRIKSTFLKTKKVSVSKLRDLIEADLDELNRKNPAATALSVPSESTIARRIAKKATPEKIKHLRDGVGKARQTYGPNHPAPRPTRPYQIVEIDITPIDILFVEYDADGNVIATFRPYLIVVVDKFTGATLAFWLGRARPNAATVARVLRRAMRPKRPDGTLTPAPAAGLIESLVVDGGGEFIETLLLAALDENRIGYRLCRAGAANLKGTVEQQFRTVASDVCAEPGRTFSNPVKKGDYDAAANAVLELEDGIRILDHFFSDIRHNHAAEGTTRPTPITSFRANEDKILTREFDEYKFAALLLDQKTAIITSKGIRYDSLFYDTKKSGVIAALHRDFGEGAEITIKPDDDDLTQIVAICLRSGVRLFVPLVSLDNVAGLSREQFHAQRKADLAVNGEKEGRPARLAARLQIEKVVNAAEKKRRKAKSSKKGATPVAAIDDSPAPAAAIEDSPAPPASSEACDAFLPIEPLEGAADDGSDEPSPLFDWA
jgi:putative transposase